MLKKSSTPNRFKKFMLVLLTSLVSGLLLYCGSTYVRRFENPARAEIARQQELKALARGREIWFDPNTGTNERSCESCHPKGEMTSAESYPRYKHILRTMATLSMTNNFAVVNESKGKPWQLGSSDANALVLYVKSLANNKTIRMAPPQKYKDEWVNRGKMAFNDLSLGTNNLACSNCHKKNNNNEKNIQNSVVGNLNGIAATFPRYSFAQKKVITLEQQINYCLESKMQGSPLPLDDETIVALCCYITSLSEGKKIAVASLK